MKTQFCLWLTDPGTRPLGPSYGGDVVSRRGCYPTKKLAQKAAKALRKKTSYTVNVMKIFK